MGKLESESKRKRGGRGRTAPVGITAAAPSCRRQEGGGVEREEELREEGEPLCLHRRRQFAFCCRRGKPPPSSSSSRAGCCQLPPPSHLPSRTTLRTHRRDRSVEIGRRRKKEEALFACCAQSPFVESPSSPLLGVASLSPCHRKTTLSRRDSLLEGRASSRELRSS
ncbi:hypothetical protein AHAS_Ahas12G0108800 [Arachis hypogaea]